VTGGSYVFVLDNEAPNPNPTGAASQILAYTIGSGGALQAATNGVIPMTRTSPTLRGWRWSRRVNGSTWRIRGTTRLARDGESGLAGYVMNSPFQPTEMSGTPSASAPAPARSAWSRIPRISFSIRPTSTLQP